MALDAMSSQQLQTKGLTREYRNEDFENSMPVPKLQLVTVKHMHKEA